MKLSIHGSREMCTMVMVCRRPSSSGAALLCPHLKCHPEGCHAHLGVPRLPACPALQSLPRHVHLHRSHLLAKCFQLIPRLWTLCSVSKQIVASQVSETSGCCCRCCLRLAPLLLLPGVGDVVVGEAEHGAVAGMPLHGLRLMCMSADASSLQCDSLCGD